MRAHVEGQWRSFTPLLAACISLSRYQPEPLELLAAFPGAKGLAGQFAIGILRTLGTLACLLGCL